MFSNDFLVNFLIKVQMKGRKPRAFNPAFFKNNNMADSSVGDDIVVAAPKKNPNIDYQALA